MNEAERNAIDEKARELTKAGIRAYGTSDGDGKPCIMIYPEEADLVKQTISWAREHGARINALWFRTEPC